jgi:hypothetical protein
VRLFSALVIACSGCNRVTPPPSAPLASEGTNAKAATNAAREEPRNTTGLAVEALASPISGASVRLVAPNAGEHVALGAAPRYDVRWVSEQLDPDGLGIDVALDAYRPRRLPQSASLISLALLVPVDEQLTRGEHWLFVAPISASGLVSRRALGSPQSASAVRFLVGDGALDPATAGTVWLREPQGTYNWPRSERVLFDAQAFGPDGAPLAAPCAIHLAGELSGELRLPAPFFVLALKGGSYDARASAPSSRAASARFTVNPELGRPK